MYSDFLLVTTALVPKKFVLMLIVLTQRCQYGWHAVIGYQLHCPYKENVFELRVLLQREVTVQCIISRYELPLAVTSQCLMYPALP